MSTCRTADDTDLIELKIQTMGIIVIFMDEKSSDTYPHKKE